MKHRTCCFTGDRKLPSKKIESIITRLNQETENLIDQGVTDFISGAALGFDSIAASLILAKRELGFPVKLILALPCVDHEPYFSPDQVNQYRKLSSEADEVYYVSQDYSFNCVKKRNFYMVDQSAYCLCFSTELKGNTTKTVNYARKKGLKIIDVGDK
ncbi:MAG: hypothetical protein K0Q85_1528 [Caproiciproducens sp.]|nr:hypothetical protein [Caproiciproducens sp.]